MPAPYYCHIIGRGRPRVPHGTIEEAKAEQIRLHGAHEGRCAVVIFETIDILPVTNHSPNPDAVPDDERNKDQRKRARLSEEIRQAFSEAAGGSDVTGIKKKDKAPVVVVKKRRSIGREVV